MNKYSVSVLLCLVAPLSLSLESMTDGEMSGVSGFSGITIEGQLNELTFDQISYEQDGVSLDLNDGQIDTYTDSITTIDVESDGTFVMDSRLGDRQFLTNVGMTNSSGQSFSFGNLVANMQTVNGVSNRVKASIGYTGSSYVFDTSEFSFAAPAIIYGDDSNILLFENVTLSTVFDYARMAVNSDDMLSFDFGTESNPGVQVAMGMGAMATITGSGTSGSIDFAASLSGTLDIGTASDYGYGQSLFIDPELVFKNDASQGDALVITEDGNVLKAEDMRLQISSDSGLFIAFGEDDYNGTLMPYIGINFGDLDIDLDLENLVIGGASGASTLGGFYSSIKTASNTDNQYFRILPYGDVGTQGITFDTSLNIKSDNPVENVDPVTGSTFFTTGASTSYFGIQDNGNYVFFTGLNADISGLMHLDVVSGSTCTVANGCYANPYNSANGTFNDGTSNALLNRLHNGVRFGFEDFDVSYSLQGLTVGSTNEPQGDIMGGTELLVPAEIFPAADYRLNGNVTMDTGGKVDFEGWTFNADVRFDGYQGDTGGANAALVVNQSGRGLWLTDAVYDIHIRDGGIDIVDYVDPNSNDRVQGIQINKGLSWSTFQIGDIKFGDKNSGSSLGSFTLERLEDGSTVTLASGGAGAVCIGGSGATQAACVADGGRFEDRGDQGLTLKLNYKFAQDDGSDPRYAGKGNRISWTQPNGTTLAVENFNTSDGPNTTTNNYGLNVDLAIDVARTAVRANNGQFVDAVNGGTFTDENQISARGPLGFAVAGNIHFKQMNIDNITLAATPSSTPQTFIDAIVIQNGAIQANLTATPIR